MSDNSYIEKQKKEFYEYESLCSHCGECCGAFGNDPCVNLRMEKDGKYICAVYDARLGPQKTISGAIFNCVEIRHVIKFGVYYAKCAYMKKQGEIYE